MSGYVRIRFVVAVLGFILLALVYGMKVSLSMSIEAMINNTDVEKHSSFNIVKSDCKSEDYNNTEIKEDGPFEWSERVKGVILSSYFIGYLASQIPGGRLAEIWSAKWTLFIGGAITIGCNMLIPPTALLHWGVVIFVRIVQGIGGGIIFPATHVIISKWSPIEERSFISSIIYAGTAVGTVFFNIVSIFIIEKIAWHAPFYIIGVGACTWLILWWLLVTDNPRKNHYITDKECDYITHSLGEDTDEKFQGRIPWKQIWTSGPFLALLITQTISTLGWYLLLIESPNYYTQVFDISLRKTSIVGSTPYISLWIFSLILSGCESKLLKMNVISVGAARKFSTGCANVVPAICLVAVNLSGCRQNLIFFWMACGTTFMGGTFSGFLSNHIDIAPRLAGTLMGVTNTVASLSGVVLPIIIGELTRKNQTRQEWSIIFYSAAIAMLLVTVIFTLFGSGKVQPWNDPSMPDDVPTTDRADENEAVNKDETS